EEGAEHRRLAAGPRERAVENVEDRADDEDTCAEPVVEELVPVLERDEHRCDETQRDPRRRQGVRGDARAGEAGDRAARKAAGAGRIAVFHPGWGFVISQSCYGATIAGLRWAQPPQAAPGASPPGRRPGGRRARPRSPRARRARSGWPSRGRRTRPRRAR